MNRNPGNPPELRRPAEVTGRLPDRLGKPKGNDMSTALQPSAPSEPPISVTDGLLAVIERASRDSSVDIDKLERLFTLQERMLDRQAKLQFIEAKRAMRPFLPVITERGKIIIRDKVDRSKIIQETSFALFEDLNEILMPIVTEHGFDVTFRNGRSPDGKVCVYTVLSHVGGHSEETFFELPPDGSGSKNAVQAIGSSTSYAKRYGMLEILNITTKGEDDDGSKATIYKASGEPMPRAKLDGPHASKTALRTAVNEIISKVRAAQSNEEIDAILREGKETRKQADRDWPTLINGDPQVPEDVGLRGVVAIQRAALSEDGMVPGMIRSMKECDTKPSLDNWRIANADAIEALDGAEARTFQLAYDLHESVIAAMDRVTAGA